jgi:hypothetical protein
MNNGPPEPVSLIFEPTIQNEPLRTCSDRLHDGGIEIGRRFAAAIDPTKKLVASRSESNFTDILLLTNTAKMTVFGDLGQPATII